MELAHLMQALQNPKTKRATATACTEKQQTILRDNIHTDLHRISRLTGYQRLEVCTTD
jgi:hypothetical protein